MLFQGFEAQHDHTPAYTEQLGAALGQTVRVRMRTTLPVTDVALKVVQVGEIETLPAQEITGPAGFSGEGRWFEAHLPLHDQRVRYAWQLNLTDDHLNLTALGLHRSRRGFRSWFQYLAGHVAPEWAWRSVFYQIFPDRFRNGDPTNDVQTGEYIYEGRPVEHVAWDHPVDAHGDIHGHYGGDLNGVTQALPYLKDLGITGLWLTPIFESPSNHRYDITDYRRVDPHLGGEDAWDELVQEADQAGIRIVLDGVFNHMGNENALFRAALESEDAPERSLFTWRDEPGKPPYHSFFDVPTLPKIDYRNESAVEEFFSGESSVVRHWLRQGAAGWRLDVAHMIGAGGTDTDNLPLHRALKTAARQERPDAYVFGERFYDPEHALDGQGEDGTMNYHGFGLPVMQWLAGATYFQEPSRISGPEVAEIMWDAYHALAPEVALSMFNLLESHDIGRALYRLGNDRTRFLSAFTLLVAYPGVPCTYYGTEIGLSQSRPGNMPWCREPMPWDESQWDLELHSRVKALIAVRRQTAALHSGNLRFLHAEPDALAFLREITGADGQTSRVIALASRRTDAHEVSLTLPAGEWRDALTGEAMAGGAAILNATGGRLLLQH
ncbi:alpha-amylase family glycosyl hydrolase [Deinococcus deserti]|uniref:Putative Neopullulanase (Alpha-amylase) n=1 Tax=Deinococcus deserti (strain DSM 17065 / CIP 109153 / LMG 22923 / VCD115) TaxID=546414 RepID=C1CVC0_DEIDV|nr:alpha-amylase family glycosyl hydrolase [Deinococcus deserti]ACO46137.1 putative Neopullulanase (Alpha-amylase) [Deinococcus deserti VCD115]